MSRDVKTSDPVSMVEIAERCEVKYQKVTQWRANGSLPEPHWMVGTTPIWAWEILQSEQVIAEIVGGESWDGLLGMVPAAGPFWVTVMDYGDNGNDVRVAMRRIDRKDKGLISVPLPDRRTFLMTDSEEGDAWERVDRREAMKRLSKALNDEFPKTRRTAEGERDDWRRPKSRRWAVTAA